MRSFAPRILSADHEVTDPRVAVFAVRLRNVLRFMKILLEVLPTPLEIPSLGRVVRSDSGREASELVSAPENSAEVLPCPKGAHHSSNWRRKAAPPRRCAPRLP